MSENNEHALTETESEASQLEGETEKTRLVKNYMTSRGAFPKDPEAESLVQEFLMNVQKGRGEGTKSTDPGVQDYGMRLAIDFGREHGGFQVGQVVGYRGKYGFYEIYNNFFKLKAFDGENVVITDKAGKDKVVPLNEIFDTDLLFILFLRWEDLRIKISSAKRREEDRAYELSPEEEEERKREMQELRNAFYAAESAKVPDEVSQPKTECPVGWQEVKSWPGMREIVYRPGEEDLNKYVSISFEKNADTENPGVSGRRGWVRRNIQVEDRYPNDGEAFSDKELFRVLEEEGVNLPPEIKALMVSVRRSIAASIGTLSVSVLLEKRRNVAAA